MNATQKQDKSLAMQLEALGIHIEVDDEAEFQKSNAAQAKEDAKLLLSPVRAWLGATALRELYIARQRNDRNKKVKINLSYFATELSKPGVLEQYFKIYIQRMCNGSEEKIQQAVTDLTTIRSNPDFTINKWSLLRAMNGAIRRSNYGQFMRKAGWCYTGDSDHKVITTMLTGQYKWTEPEIFTVGTVEAETEEDYLAPYTLTDIPNPDNPDETIKCRVYKRQGNVVHPSSNVDQIDLMENDPLINELKNLAPGKVLTKQYDREDGIQEFERQAERDVNFVLEKAEEMGIRLWPSIQPETKVVMLYHAGNLDGTCN